MEREQRGLRTWFALGAGLFLLIPASALLSTWEKAPAQRRVSLQSEIEALDAQIREIKADAIREAAGCAADAVQFGASGDIARGCREAQGITAPAVGELVAGLQRERDGLNAQLQRLPE